MHCHHLSLARCHRYAREALKADISFTSISADPNSYSINWDQPALSAGFVNVDAGTKLAYRFFCYKYTSNAPAAVYTGTLNIKNSTCSGHRLIPLKSLFDLAGSSANQWSKRSLCK
jgi:hypothetical protein